MKSVFCLILIFLLNGCVTTNNLESFNPIQKDIIKKIMTDDGALFYNIKAADLDKDGRKEAIIIYAFGTHQSGVKVIRFEGDNANILFEGISNTANTDFEVINNVPTIILEQSEYMPDYATGKRYKETYQWDGKTFKLKNKKTVENE